MKNTTKVLDWRRIMNDNNNIVWHYCSYEAFKKIIESRSFKLSNIQLSNDPSELSKYKQYKDELCKYLYGERSSVAEFSFENEFSRDFYTTRFACFSLAKDSLPMWYMYGDECRGVAIGFSKGWFEKVINNLSNNHFIFPVFGKVRYSNIDQRKLIEEICSSNNPIKEHDIAKLSFFKSECYSFEDEVRIAVRTENNQFGHNYHQFSNEIWPFFFANQNNYMSDLFLSIEAEDGDEPITKIIIGPCFDAPLYRLFRFAYANGIKEDKIETSNIKHILKKDYLH